jgi:hypothetical protein
MMRYMQLYLYENKVKFNLAGLSVNFIGLRNVAMLYLLEIYFKDKLHAVQS